MQNKPKNEKKFLKLNLKEATKATKKLKANIFIYTRTQTQTNRNA